MNKAFKILSIWVNVTVHQYQQYLKVASCFFSQENTNLPFKYLNMEGKRPLFLFSMKYRRYKL